MNEFDELTRALEVNKAVYEAVRGYIRPGVSEKDIYELTNITVDKMLLDVSHEFIGDFVGGKRCGLIPTMEAMLNCSLTNILWNLKHWVN